MVMEGGPPKVNFSIQIFLYLSNERLSIYFKFHFLSFGEDPKLYKWFQKVKIYYIPHFMTDMPLNGRKVTFNIITSYH